MELSHIGYSVEQIDQLLNELEQIAHSHTSRTKFYGALLERLRFVLSAQGTAFVVPVDGKRWGVVASAAHTDLSGYLEPWIDAWDRKPDVLPSDNSPEVGSSEVGSWRPDQGQLLSAFVSRHQPSRGAVLAVLPHEPDPASRQDLCGLIQAFAEIIGIRQSADLDEFLNRKLPAFQSLLNEVSSADSAEEAATLAVNNLIPILSADRIGLIQRTAVHGDRLLAISGSVAAASRSESSLAVRNLGTQALDSGKPESLFRADRKAFQQASPDLAVAAAASTAGSSTEPPAENCLAENYIAFPLGKSIGQTSLPHNAALVVEWSDYEELLRAASLLNAIMPTFDIVWRERMRWLRSPRWVRAVASSSLMSGSGLGNRAWMRWALVASILASVLWLMTRPYDLRIEMNGVLEPEIQRTVYANQDGVVTQVLVRDSQTVAQGQLMVVMRAPTLELQIEEVLGELKANVEKRDAISLNINQLARDNSATPSVLNRLSSEVRQLETMQSTLESKLTALRSEESQLRIVSPINGIVVARDLDKLLDSRPLRRGDALFRIVNPDAPWRLQLAIADSDVGYVKQQLFGESRSLGGAVPEDSQHRVEFVLAARPDERFQAPIVWIAETARNPRGSGVTVDAIASIPAQAMDDVYVGATAHAFMICGQRPAWFVFSRPLVENIQRKLWF